MEPTHDPVGIDVSKQTLDVALLTMAPSPKNGKPRATTGRFANQPDDFASLLAFLQTHASRPVHVCLEATGTYHDGLLLYLLQHGIRVSLLPSARLHDFRGSEGMRSKTDKIDAVLLARYCQQKDPPAYQAVPDDLMQLRQWLGRLADLSNLRQQERNRLENTRLDPETRKEISEHIQQLERWIKERTAKIRTWIKAHADLQQAETLLRSIKGIGEKSAWELLAILGPDARRFESARQLVVYLGLDVARKDSGKRIKAGHISKQGPSRVRGCLGMAAIVARRWSADVSQWASELTARGKKPKQVRVAIMRKLLHLAYGVLTHQQPYDSRRAWPTHQLPEAENKLAA